jgi:hypothetical protein
MKASVKIKSPFPFVILFSVQYLVPIFLATHHSLFKTESCPLNVAVSLLPKEGLKEIDDFYRPKAAVGGTSVDRSWSLQRNTFAFKAKCTGRARVGAL